MIQNVKTFCQLEHCYVNIPRLFLVHLFGKLCYHQTNTMLDMLYLKVVDAASLVWFQNVQSFEVSSPKMVQECLRKNVHLS